ncbi:MAG: CehA/McbA family metallohydrolase [Pseudomonadota bacterium]|nr:CehA/McbA family metallohydrolase [Pseudomonadota bacterium]
MRAANAGFTLLALLMLLLPFTAYAEGREPVLRQVSVPHSYYWREMYVPQLTQGPGSLAWTRDGKSLVYSMRGKLWRQSLDSGVARQLTTGDGYDYQPDVSPDDKRAVFARYDNDAIELFLLDLASGKTAALTRNGAVNLEPRWSPDGSKIAFVTTAESGKFHIAIAERKGGAWSVRRWRPERVSETPRYYYSQTDHELSPSWSPDGKELIFVANPEVVHGTGAIYRQPFDLSAPAALIRDEETNWKARPDWSPDGKRVAYSSYLGRQFNQLWMTTAAPGGYPVPFSYGDFDVTSPRWSPDGSKIAYISNQGGDGEIIVQEVVGGARRTLKAQRLDYRQPMARLSLSVVDAQGNPVPARASIVASDGRSYAPEGVMIHADDGFDHALQPFETHYFHTDGSAEAALPPGEATVTVWRGLENAVETRKVMVGKSGAGVEIIFASLNDDGLFNGWESGDPHVHMNYGGAYRMTPERLLGQAAAEDLDIVFNLIVNKEQRIPDIGYFSTETEEGEGVLLAQAQEYHTSVWGHLGLIGLEDHYLLGDYVGYPKTALASLYPDNAAVSRLARAQGALVGYVHPFDVAPDPANDQKLTNALPVDVALGAVDYIEAVGFSDHRETEKVWHALLNCGFRLPAAGATDAMTDYASLRGPVGMNRTYVWVDEPVPNAKAHVRRWLDGLKAGRSFATNGPLLSLTVGDAGPGGEIRLKNGVHRLSWSAEIRSIAPVDRVEIVVNGAVAVALPLSDDGRSAAGMGEIEVDGSGWVLLRAVSDKASPLVFDLYPYATTSPVYVTVGGKPVRSAADAGYFIKWIDRLIDFAQASEAWNTEAERAAVLDNFARARREFEKRH